MNAFNDLLDKAGLYLQIIQCIGQACQANPEDCERVRAFKLEILQLVNRELANVQATNLSTL